MVRIYNNLTLYTATSTSVFAVALCVSSLLMSTPATASAPPTPSVAALATLASRASAAAAFATNAESAASASVLRASIATKSAQDAKSRALSLTAAAVVAANETRALARSNATAAIKAAAKVKSAEAARAAKDAQRAAQSAQRIAAAQESAAVRATRSANSMRLAANAQAAIVTRMTSQVTLASASVVVQSGSTPALPSTIPAQNTAVPSVVATTGPVLPLNVATTGPVLPPAVVSFPIIFDNGPTSAFVSPIDTAQRYLIVYQSDFSTDDPATHTDVDINVNAVIAAIGRKVSASGSPQWGVLDIENPFDEVLKAGPSDARFDSAVASLVNTIRAVRVAYPQTKWTYYGFPRVPYWLGVKDWGGITPEVREANYVQFARNYEPVMAEMDWFMPSLYDVYERARAMPNSASVREVAEAEYRKACICVISRWFDRASVVARPIIPVVSPWFQPGGVATSYQAIPMDEFCAEQVRPAIEAGANGMAVWGEMGFFLKMATAPQLPSAQYVQEWRAQTRAAFTPLVPAATSGMMTIDWTAPSTIIAIGATLNQTLADAMRAIEARGEVPQ